MVDARYDKSVPGLLLTIGAHDWDYGALATVRSLGRVGVPMYATVAVADGPLTRSKYLTAPLLWSTTGAEADDALVTGILELAKSLGRPAVAIAGDDETAVLLARYADQLRPHLLLPPVPPELPATLASKTGLADLCAEFGAPTPKSVTPGSHDEIEAFVSQASFPLVVKNPEPFSRLVAPAVASTTRVADRAALDAALVDWQPGRDLLIQEFIPEQTSDDWYVEAVVTAAGEVAAAFSGRKLRAFPRSTGVGTLSESAHDQRLIDLATKFCRDIGYVGVADMDWRYDRRDDTYKLLDFNPRRGAQFRLFQSEAGIDVVRALHLLMTGREVPVAPQLDGLRHVVGILDQRAYLADRRAGGASFGPLQGRGTERSWWAADDPQPAIRFASQLGPVAKLRAKLPWTSG